MSYYYYAFLEITPDPKGHSEREERLIAEGKSLKKVRLNTALDLPLKLIKDPYRSTLRIYRTQSGYPAIAGKVIQTQHYNGGAEG